MQLLHRAIRRELVLQFLLYGGLLATGAGIIWRFLESNTLLVLAGLFFAFLGLFYLIRLSRHCPVKRHPIMVQLHREPNQVVWVYTVVTQRMPYGLAVREYGLLYLKLMDGEELCVSMPTRHLRVVSHFLNRLLPHATFGYSPNKEQLYRINPEMLIR